MDNKQCYLCGEERNLTREHIPPKNLFPEPRPSNLITVPCCANCNHANQLTFDVKQIDQLRLNDIIPAITAPLCYAERGDGVFRYWRPIITESPDAGIWILLFYDAIGFEVCHHHARRISQAEDPSRLMQSSSEGGEL